MGDFWKYVAIAAIGALGGLFTGQFIPNRNIVTNDQLVAATAPIQANQLETQKQLSDLKDQVNELKGELRAKKMLAQ